MKSRHDQMKEARALGSIAVQMFGHPEDRLGRFGGRLMLRRSEPGYAWLAQVLAPGGNDVFLDIGCGPGGLLRAVLPSAGEVVGVDPSSEMVAMAAANTGAEVNVGPAERLPLVDGRFTIVCAMHTVDLWESIEGGRCEMARVLASGGRAAIVVRTLDAGAKSWNPASDGYNETDFRELSDAMRRSGFDDIERYCARPGAEELLAIVGTLSRP